MTREEFAATCASCGYASRKFALAYAGDRDNLTEDDFIEVYRAAQGRGRRSDFRDVMAPDGSRTRTTKHYIRIGTDGRER